MKTLILTVFAAWLASAPATAQKLDLGGLDGLAAKAKEHSEINLDGQMLTQILAGAKAKVGDKAAILGGVEGVYIRTFEFAKAGEYSDSDLASLRKQVGSGSGWSRIIDVKEKDESTQIYVLNQGGQPAGLLILSAEAKELNVIHIRGSISLAQAEELVKSTIHYDLSKLEKPDSKQ